MTTREGYQQLLTELTRKFADEGKLIEAGWLSLRVVWLKPDTPDFQVRDCRMAFMAGAQHLFHSIMHVLDPDDEPTDADLRRMELIDTELKAFLAELQRLLPTHERPS